MKELTFETSEDFQAKCKEFVQLLQTLTQSVAGVAQPHKDLMEVQIINHGNPFLGKEVYSVYRSAVDKKAYWCKGRLEKQQAKDIESYV